MTNEFENIPTIYVHDISEPTFELDESSEDVYWKSKMVMSGHGVGAMPYAVDMYFPSEEFAFEFFYKAASYLKEHNTPYPHVPTPEKQDVH